MKEDIVHAVFSASEQQIKSDDTLLEKLSLYINDLINNDFDKLISLLYRIDVNEKKLTQLLHENAGKDAGNLIAAMIIERQLEKIKLRNNRKDNNDPNINAEDKW